MRSPGRQIAGIAAGMTTVHNSQKMHRFLLPAGLRVVQRIGNQPGEFLVYQVVYAPGPAVDA